MTAYAVSRIVPQAVGVWIADTASGAAHALKRHERQAVRRNLAAIWGLSADSEQVRRAARGVYRNFGRSCVELLYETRRSGSPVLPSLEMVRRELFDAALAEGKGVILVGAHTGSWELGAMALASRGIPLTVLTHTPAAGAFELYQRHRARAGLEVIETAGGLHRCMSALRSGGALGLLADRRFGSTGFSARLFKRPARLPQGAVRLSLCSGAPIVGATFRIPLHGGRPVLKFWDRIDPPVLRSDEKTADAMRRRLAALVEAMIAEFPEEWYCFEDFWDPSGSGKTR